MLATAGLVVETTLLYLAMVVGLLVIPIGIPGQFLTSFSVRGGDPKAEETPSRSFVSSPFRVFVFPSGHPPELEGMGT